MLAIENKEYELVCYTSSNGLLASLRNKKNKEEYFLLDDFYFEYGLVDDQIKINKLLDEFTTDAKGIEFKNRARGVIGQGEKDTIPQGSGVMPLDSGNKILPFN